MLLFKLCLGPMVKDKPCDLSVGETTLKPLCDPAILVCGY